MFSRCELLCCICGAKVNWTPRGEGICVCGTECYREFDWRRTLAIMGKPYEPRPEEKEKSDELQ